MFPRFNNGPARHRYIPQPGYDRLIDFYARGAGFRGDRAAKAFGTPAVPMPGAHAALGATSGPGLWTRRIFHFSRGSRCDRVHDGGGRLETRSGSRLKDGEPKDGVSPAVGTNTDS